MFKKNLPFCPLHYCSLLVCLNVFSQAVIYISDFLFKKFQSEKLLDSLLVANNKNLFSNTQNQTQINNTHTFPLTEKQFLVLGNNKKIVLQLDLETELPTDNFVSDAYTAILATTTQSVWFCYQNQLVHYDFVNNKLIRKVEISKWNPHQIVLENRTIWLISKNDGQLYGLDFELDEKTTYTLEVKGRMEFERLRCPEHDLKKIEAAKAAQEKFNNKK
jgi:hypothetical protein